MPYHQEPPAHPFTEAELRELAPVMTKIQQACDAPGLLILEPHEARQLRKLLLHLQNRPLPRA